MKTTLQYQSQLDWALAHGLFLHPSIERREVNGIYGMYATADIPKETLLASFPCDQLIDSTKGPFGDSEDARALNWLHAAACELGNKNTTFNGVIAGFESLAELKRYSYYFFNEDDLATLNDMHPVLCMWVREAKQQADHIIDIVAKAEPSCSKEDIVCTYLNMRSRAFHPFGVVPVLDQFNHSDLLGQSDKFSDGKLCVHAKVDYQAGAQLFISYGAKDLYDHAIHYNYFDQGGPHFINFGKKAVHSAEGAVGQKVLAHIKRFFPVNELDIAGQKAFNLNAPLILLIEDSPSVDLVKALTEISRVRINKPAQETEVKAFAIDYFRTLLDDQLKLNQVDQVDESTVPDKLLRFYHLLKKEKAMLMANRQKLPT